MKAFTALKSVLILKIRNFASPLIFGGNNTDFS
jgi:hypothetical protein